MASFHSYHNNIAQQVMSESEAKRLKSRKTNMEIIKILQDDNDSEDPMKRKEHTCYMHLVGFIETFNRRQSSTDIETDAVELQMAKTKLYQNIDELLGKRDEFAVFEDNIGSKLEKMLLRSAKPSYENLKTACCKHLTTKQAKTNEETCNNSFHIFTNQGIEKNEAKAYAYAIAFYTGSYSEEINKNAGLLARADRRNASTDVEKVKVDPNAALIMYYLIKGLSHIEYYWGVVNRFVELSPEELADYQPGVLVTWLQFSSSNRGHLKSDWCSDRNTIFIIFSLTGRCIRPFSNCAAIEDEVLFLPHSSFLVCYKEEKNGKRFIYLRQVSTFCHLVYKSIE